MRAILLGPQVSNRATQLRLFHSLQICPDDLIVGIDGGASLWKKWGIRPHFAVGDWDSIESNQDRKKALRDLPRVTLPRDKDRSDLFFAALAAIEAGARELIALGVTGGRPDHHVATLMDLSQFSTGRYGKLARVRAVDSSADLIFLSEGIPVWKESLAAGQLFSVFALGDRVNGVSICGAQYCLKNVSLTPSSLGLSNVAKGRVTEIRVRQGRLLLVIPWGAKN